LTEENFVPQEEDIALAAPAAELSEDHAATVKSSLSRNVVVDSAARVGYLLSRFFIPPFVLAHVSLEAYGLWSTAFMLVSYAGISTLGISNVFIKYAAEYSAQRRFREANSLISTGLLITLPVCGSIFAALVVGWPLLSKWLHIAPNLQGDAHEVILSVAGIFLAAMSLAVFRDILVGVQKTDLVQYIWIAGYTIETPLMFFLVAAGRGVRGLAEAYVARTVLEIGISIPTAFKVLPWLRISPRLFSRQAIHTLVSFGGVVQIQSLLAIFLDSVERALAVPLLGLAPTALLDISQKLPTMGATVPSAFATAFLPAASYLHGGLEGTPEQRESVQKLYLKGCRYMNLTTAYICGFIAACAGPLFQVWMGKIFPGAVYLMVSFTIATQVHLLTGPGTSILRGIGRPKEEFYYCIPNVLFLCLTVPLARLIEGHWSVLGIGTAVPAATLLASIYFLIHANRVLQIPGRLYFNRVFAPGLLPYLLGLIFTYPVVYAVHESSRWIGALWIGLAGLLYTALVAFVIDRFVWEAGERLWFHAIISAKVSQLRKRLPNTATAGNVP
jgi:O-antigen/teichoic acid export membrane protein